MSSVQVSGTTLDSTQHAYKELRPPLLIDLYLIVITFILVGFGLLMVYSTTAVVAQEKFGDTLFFVKRQALAAVLGVLSMLVLSRIPPHFLRKFSPYLFGMCIVLLLASLIPGLGDSAGGARRWVVLGSLRFQPSEIVKLFFVIFMASFFARQERKLSQFQEGVVKPLLLAGLMSGLLLLQPDFGSAAVLMLVTLGMAGASGTRLFHLTLCAIVLGFVLGGLVYLSPYRMSRVVSFLSPFQDASGKGYQLIQSLIAVGSGQLGGVGLGASQQKLFFLPAAHTDFIFAVIAEELGFFGALVLMLLFVLLLWRGLRLASLCVQDTFSFALALGLTGLIVLPAFLNMGVVLGLLPTKGMVLPFVGYGGSSLVGCLCAVGLLLSVARAHQSGKL